MAPTGEGREVCAYISLGDAACHGGGGYSAPLKTHVRCDTVDDLRGSGSCKGAGRSGESYGRRLEIVIRAVRSAASRGGNEEERPSVGPLLLCIRESGAA